MDKEEGDGSASKHPHCKNIHISKNISKHLDFESPEQVPKANVIQAGGVIVPGGAGRTVDEVLRDMG